MSKAVRYRVVEVAHKPRQKPEEISYIIQRKGLLFWHSKMEWTSSRDQCYDSLEKAVESIKEWHDWVYAETYTKKRIVKTIEFRVSN